MGLSPNQLRVKFYSQYGKNIKISAVIGLLKVPIKKTIFIWLLYNKKVFNISQFFLLNKKVISIAKR